MSDISPSAIQTNQKINDAINRATSQAEVQQILRQAAMDQNLVHPDYYDPNVLLPTDRAAEPTKSSRSITVEGKTISFEGDSEADIERIISVYLREQLRPAETPEVQVGTPPRDERGRFVNEDDLVAKVELDLRFKRGELSTADYLEQSGAVKDYLEKQGIPIEELKSSIEQKRNENVEHSWKSVTQEFLNSPAGSDWPGGPENLKAIGEVLTAMHVEDSPSVENLEAAYKYLKDHDQIAENPELIQAKKISEAKSFSEVQDALGSHGSLFGR
jgi:hypothetical protein